MSETLSTTRWRDKSVIPADYSDNRRLAPLARKARSRIVEFDWYLSRQDLEELRRAVFEWGALVQGSFRCFDARVLAAIAQALGDTNTVFLLNEPTRAVSRACAVSCDSLGEMFCLHGQATFDVVFGYGMAGLEGHGPGRSHLGPTVRETLVASVGMLGWDLHQLHCPERWPVVNVLYGLRPDYGSALPPPLGPAIDVPVHFQGPFSAFHEDRRPCLFTHPVARRSGVYLWTINVEGQDRPWYVGQTLRGFGTRMSEHVANYLSGRYPAEDAAALVRGEHHWAEGTPREDWPQSIPTFLMNYERVGQSILALIQLLTFYVAPLEVDEDLLDRVEGAIGRHYKEHPDPVLKNLFTPGLKLPALMPGDHPVRLMLSSDAPIAGLPPEILA